MDAFLQLSILFEYYGVLLTDTQQEICDLYYNQNFTLTEIAEDMGITKQGVRDALKKSEKLLYKYENLLLIRQKNEKLSALIQGLACEVEHTSIPDADKQKILNIANQINDLI